MPRTLPSGATVPTGADQFAYEQQMLAAGLTAGRTIIVKDRAAMNAKIQEMRSLGYPPTTAFGVEFYIRDEKRTVLHDGSSALTLMERKSTLHEVTYTANAIQHTQENRRIRVTELNGHVTINGDLHPANRWEKNQHYHIFTLPEGIRPPQRLGGTGGASAKILWVYILPSGEVYIESEAPVLKIQNVYFGSYSWDII